MPRFLVLSHWEWNLSHADCTLSDHGPFSIQARGWGSIGKSLTRSSILENKEGIPVGVSFAHCKAISWIWAQVLSVISASNPIKLLGDEEKTFRRVSWMMEVANKKWNDTIIVIDEYTS